MSSYKEFELIINAFLCLIRMHSQSKTMISIVTKQNCSTCWKIKCDSHVPYVPTLSDTTLNMPSQAVVYLWLVLQTNLFYISCDQTYSIYLKVTVSDCLNWLRQSLLTYYQHQHLIESNMQYFGSFYFKVPMPPNKSTFWLKQKCNTFILYILSCILSFSQLQKY